ncbi:MULTISPECIES: Acg family FMN-binding oxidoreductase [Protofrankia]|uniref:Nitroreductase n=1 Tax=Candidatus Protofrankia datiscae TaxID=2716812 RepID=F8B269_9ACTN|nr:MULTISPECIES: nitroreductase [Protofrankia]AEH09863.1 nitroreductase [Candidatus Protofrankia datiscae]
MSTTGVVPSPEQIEEVVAEAALAPSIHDTQPWHWFAGTGCLELFTDPSLLLGAIDPDGRQLLISCGAALYHARLALRARDLLPAVTLLPDGPGYADLDMDLAGREPLATIRAGTARPPDAEERALIAATRSRITDRQPLRPAPVPATITAALTKAAEAEGCWLATLSAADVAALSVDGVWLGAMGRHTAADWTGAPITIGTHATTGTAAATGTAGTPDAAGGTGPDAVGRRTGVPTPPAGLRRPTVVALGTDADRPVDRLAAGQAVARILLTATAHGAAARPVGHAEDIDAIRVRVRELLRSTGHVQMIFLVGYPLPGGRPVEPAPRRPTAEILTIVD